MIVKKWGLKKKGFCLIAASLARHASLEASKKTLSYYKASSNWNLRILKSWLFLFNKINYSSKKSKNFTKKLKHLKTWKISLSSGSSQ